MCVISTPADRPWAVDWRRRGQPHALCVREVSAQLSVAFKFGGLPHKLHHDMRRQHDPQFKIQRSHALLHARASPQPHSFHRVS
jgi:hypothetical protein